MDSGVLKAPAEVLATRVKAFKNCLQLATECLTNKDYMNAEMIYGGILSDLHKDCIVEALNLNDLELFSLHSCFAYSSIGADYKSEQALVILNSIHKPIKLPLVPYLKAFVHISNDRLSFAHDELRCCQTLLKTGYNFKANNILNEEIVPEINDDFLKIKVNGLQVACELLKDREDNEELKKCFKDNWLKIGQLCETDFAKRNIEKQGKGGEETKKETMAEKKGKKGNQLQTGAVKKTEKPSDGKNEIGIQTTPPKLVTVGVQTMEKEINKQLLTTVLDIKNKMNNMQSKKDTEIKQLQKKNNELSEKLIARDTKRLEKTSEFDFLKEQFVTLEKKYEQSQKHIEFLQKLLIEQLQQKYSMQKNIYQLFEEKCDYKIVYLCDIQKYLHPSDRPTPEECKQEVSMWKNTLTRVSGAKKDFEAYYRTIDDLIVSKKYSTIKTNEWPGLPTVPNDMQDMIYRNFKIIIQQSNSLYSSPMPNNHSAIFGNYGNFKENDRNPNHVVNNYNTHKEDGRTTGSPNFYSKFNPSTSIPNGNKIPQQYQQAYQQFQNIQQQYQNIHQQHHPTVQQQHSSVPSQQQQQQHHPSPVLSQQQQLLVQQQLQQRAQQQVQQVHQQLQQQQQQFQNKKLEAPPSPPNSTPSSTNEPVGTYKSEQDLFKFLQSNFKELGELELLECIYQIREESGGSLLGWSRKALVDQIRKNLKKTAGAKCTWDSVPTKTLWHNDHSDNKCCICFEDYDATSSHSLPCQHEFHKKCITNWLKRQSACPVCRVHAVIDEEFPPLKV